MLLHIYVSCDRSVSKFPVLTLDGKKFCVANGATIKQFPEILRIWVTKTLK
jgi:hypothetical protein